MVQTAIERCLKGDPGLKLVSVNSAPNSIKFYEKLGFVPTDSERLQNGIRFVPMELEIDRELIPIRRQITSRPQVHSPAICLERITVRKFRVNDIQGIALIK